jgi:hypothetical protein
LVCLDRFVANTHTSSRRSLWGSWLAVATAAVDKQSRVRDNDNNYMYMLTLCCENVALVNSINIQYIAIKQFSHTYKTLTFWRVFNIIR